MLLDRLSGLLGLAVHLAPMAREIVARGERARAACGAGERASSARGVFVEFGPPREEFVAGAGGCGAGVGAGGFGCGGGGCGGRGCGGDG